MDGKYNVHKNYRRLKVCNCSTESLAKLICTTFDEGDIIGLTFIAEGVASIATGIYCDIVGTVVIVKDLLLKDTISYIPLSDVSSVEKGITTIETSDKPLSVKLR